MPQQQLHDQDKKKTRPTQASEGEMRGGAFVSMPTHQTVQRARQQPQGLAPTEVLQLQSSMGNRAVTGMLQRAAPTIQRTPDLTIQRTHDDVIQRKGFFSRFRRKGKSNKSRGKSTEVVEPTPLHTMVEDRGEDVTEGSSMPDKSLNKDAPADKFRLTLAVNRMDKNFLKRSTRFFIIKTLNKMLPKRFRKTKDQLYDIRPDGTGHAWIEMTRFQGGDVTDYRSYGFYPDGTVHSPDSFAGVGVYDSDNLYKDYLLSTTQYDDAVKKAEDYAEKGRNKDIRYNLYGLNCTSFAREIVRAAGQSFPGMRVAPGTRVGPGSAFTPNRLYNALGRRKRRGKALDYKSYAKRSGDEADKVQEFIGPTSGAEENIGDAIRVNKNLTLYDASEIEQDILEAGSAIRHIDRPVEGGWREVLTDLSYWVKQDELEDALGMKVGPDEYHTLSEIQGEDTTTSETSTGSTDSSEGTGEMDPTMIEEMLAELEEDF